MLVKDLIRKLEEIRSIAMKDPDIWIMFGEPQVYTVHYSNPGRNDLPHKGLGYGEIEVYQEIDGSVIIAQPIMKNEE